MSSSIVRRSSARLDPRSVLLALVIAHQTRIAAERAATARDVRRARAAARAGAAVAHALAQLERLQLPDRAAWAAEYSGANPLPIPSTTTPAERAWILGWHLLAATVRLHHRASDAGRPTFGERQTAKAAAYTRDALRELEPLLTPLRRAELRAALAPAALSLDAQLQVFAPLLTTPRQDPADLDAARRSSRR